MSSSNTHDTEHVTTEMESIGTTRREQATAMLSSVLLLVGVLTIGMFAAWLSTTMVRARPAAEKMIPVDVGGGNLGDRLDGGNKDLDVPSLEEAREFSTVGQIDPAWDSIASLVSTEVVDLDTFDLVGRKKGEIGPGNSPGDPSWKRWEIKFSSYDVEVYAQQLDFFKVELGVAGGGRDQIDYCANLSAPRPSRRSGTSSDEKRLFFLYKSGSLRDADRALARKAGIDVTDRVVVQFYTQEMYQRLLIMENERMGKRRISEVKKTTFAVRGSPGHWEFYVEGQQY